MHLMVEGIVNMIVLVLWTYINICELGPIFHWNRTSRECSYTGMPMQGNLFVPHLKNMYLIFSDVSVLQPLSCHILSIIISD